LAVVAVPGLSILHIDHGLLHGLKHLCLLALAQE
jgi:hypothetical protein